MARLGQWLADTQVEGKQRMAKLFKLFCDGAVKKAAGKLHAYTAEGDDDRFCIKVFPQFDSGDFEGYVLRLSEAEARKLQRYLNDYLG